MLSLRTPAWIPLAVAAIILSWLITGWTETEKVPDTGSARSIASPLSTLELRDQFGNTNSLASQRGAAVVVMVVSVRRLSMIERWERDLSERVPGIRFLNVADLPEDGVVDLERTAATLRKRVPAGVPVLMDADRRWATSYDLDTALPNLLVFDADGIVLARFRGRWTAGLAADVAATVPRAEPRPAPGAAPPASPAP